MYRQNTMRHDVAIRVVVGIRNGTRDTDACDMKCRGGFSWEYHACFQLASGNVSKYAQPCRIQHCCLTCPKHLLCT